MVQEVIVYRNPAEAAFWNGITGNPEIVIAGIVGLCVFLIMVNLINRIFIMLQRRSIIKRYVSRDVIGYYQLTGATVIAVLAAYAMFSHIS